MQRRWLASLAGLALLLCAAPAATSAPKTPDGGPYRVQMIYRVGKSLAPFDIDVIQQSDHVYSFWTIIELQRQGKGWKQGAEGVGLVAEGLGTPYPAVYGIPASPLPSCPDAPGCGYPTPPPFGDGSASFTAKPKPTSRYYVVSAHSPKIEVRLSSREWRVKDVSHPGVRRVLADHSASVGAGAMSRYVEHFTTASASGGRYGSAAYVAVPCAGGGVGSARLTARGAVHVSGHMDPPPLQCSPTTHAGDFDWAYTPVQATWRLEGDVKGVAYALTRLFVFDFPKP